jgi:hypothetical protein
MVRVAVSLPPVLPAVTV